MIGRHQYVAALDQCAQLFGGVIPRPVSSSVATWTHKSWAARVDGVLRLCPSQLARHHHGRHLFALICGHAAAPEQCRPNSRPYDDAGDLIAILRLLNDSPCDDMQPVHVLVHPRHVAPVQT